MRFGRSFPVPRTRARYRPARVPALLTLGANAFSAAALTATSYPLTATLTDPFTALNGSVWNAFQTGNPAAPTMAGGVLTVPNGSAGGDQSNIQTQQPFNLTGSSLACEITPGIGVNGEQDFQLVNTVTGLSLTWLCDGQYWNGSCSAVSGDLISNPLSPAYAWLRFREAAGIVFWEVSADGIVWTTVAQANAGVGGCTSMTVQWRTYCYGTASGATPMQISNLNLTPSGMGTVPSFENLIPNPSFEYDATGSSTPAAWGTNGWGEVLDVVTADAASGSQALLETWSTSNAGGGAYPGVNLSLPVVGGVTYMVRLALTILTNSYGGTPAMQIGCYDVNNNFLGNFGCGASHSPWPAGTSGELVGFFTPPAGSVSGGWQVFFGDYNSNTNDSLSYVIDAIMVAPGTVGQPYADGDTQGWAWSGAPGDSASVVPTPLATLVDSFPGPGIDSQFDLNDTGSPADTITINNGLTVPLTGGYPGVLSTLPTPHVYGLIGSSIYLLVTPPAVGNGSKYTGLELDSIQGQGGLGFQWQDNGGASWQGFWRDNAGNDNYLIQANLGSEPLWVRIRESAGTVYWDYTANATPTGWTNLDTVADTALPFSLNSLYVKLAAGYYGTESPSNALFQSLNVSTTPVSLTLAAAGVSFSSLAVSSSPPAATLTDAFSGTTLNPQWSSYGTVIVGNSEAELEPTGGYAGFSAVSQVSLLGSGYTTCLTPFATISSSGSFGLGVELDVNQGNTNVGGLGWQWQDSGGAGYIQGYWADGSGNRTYLETVSWGAGVPFWVRFREVSGTVYFDYSSDGHSWNNAATVADSTLPFSLTALYPGYFAGHYAADTDQNAYVNSVNIVSTPVALTLAAAGRSTDTLAVTAGAKLTLSASSASADALTVTAASKLTLAAASTSSATLALVARPTLVLASAGTSNATLAVVASTTLTLSSAGASNSALAVTAPTQLTLAATSASNAALAVTAAATLTLAAASTSTDSLATSAASKLTLAAADTSSAALSLTASSIPFFTLTAAGGSSDALTVTTTAPLTGAALSTSSNSLSLTARALLTMAGAGTSTDVLTVKTAAPLTLNAASASTDSLAITAAATLALSAASVSADTLALASAPQITAAGTGSSTDSLTVRAPALITITAGGTSANSLAVSAPALMTFTAAGVSTDSGAFTARSLISIVAAASSSDSMALAANSQLALATAGLSSDSLKVAASSLITIAGAAQSSDALTVRTIAPITASSASTSVATLALQAPTTVPFAPSASTSAATLVVRTISPIIGVTPSATSTDSLKLAAQTYLTLHGTAVAADLLFISAQTYITALAGAGAASGHLGLTAPTEILALASQGTSSANAVVRTIAPIVGSASSASTDSLIVGGVPEVIAHGVGISSATVEPHTGAPIIPAPVVDVLTPTLRLSSNGQIVIAGVGLSTVRVGLTANSQLALAAAANSSGTLALSAATVLGSLTSVDDSAAVLRLSAAAHLTVTAASALSPTVALSAPTYIPFAANGYSANSLKLTANARLVVLGAGTSTITVPITAAPRLTLAAAASSTNTTRLIAPSRMTLVSAGVASDTLALKAIPQIVPAGVATSSGYLLVSAKTTLPRMYALASGGAYFNPTAPTRLLGVNAGGISFNSITVIASLLTLTPAHIGAANTAASKDPGPRTVVIGGARVIGMNGQRRTVS